MNTEGEILLADLATIPAAEVTEENVHLDSNTDTFQFDDDAAVLLVVNDAAQADNFINVNQWSSSWTMSDVLYQSPAASSAFDGGSGIQASVPKYMVSNHLSSIVPKLCAGIFYEDPPFLLRPRPDVDPQFVTAKTALFAYQFKAMQFEEEVERALDQMALLGTMIMKWGYCEYTIKEESYRRKSAKRKIETSAGAVWVDTPESDEIELVSTEKLISHPWIKYCDIRTVLVDPGCQFGDIRRAKWVIYRDYATYSDLDHLRNQFGYDIPSEEDLKTIFLSKPSTGLDNITLTIPQQMRGYLQHAIPRNMKTSADPFVGGLEILERWDKEKIIVVLSANGHNIVIRNEANPYGKIPFYSANWRNIPDCFYGQGLGLLIGSEQLVEQGITNLALDLLAYGLQPTAVRKKGFNVPTQNTRWEQGGIIDVDEDVDKAFKFLQMPNVPSEAWAFLQQAQSAGAATSGANEQVMQGAGAAGVRTTGMRSGTGAAAVIQANASRLDGPDGRFIRQVFEPWLFEMDNLNNRLLPASVLRQVLGQELGDEYEHLDHIDFRNAKMKYEVLAGARLGPKKEMAQMIPFVLQLLNNPTFAQNINDDGYTFSGVDIFKAMANMAGWKYGQDFIKKMSPQQQQKHQANSPAALQQMKLQAAQQGQVAEFQHEEQLEDVKQMGKAGNEVMRQVVEQALTPEEVQGTPSNTAFGSTTAL